MVNVRIKHMRRVRSKGSTYWYHRKTGERLPDDETARIRRVLEINEGLDTPSRKVKVGSVEAVANVYRASPVFKDLAAKTRLDYDSRLKVLCSLWGNQPIASIARRHVIALQDEFADKPATADRTVTVLRVLLAFAVKREYRDDNPAEGVEKLRKPSQVEGQLQINRDKSRVCRTDGVEFVGYAFHGYGGRIQVSPKKIALFKQRASEILNRNRGVSMSSRLNELKLYLRGWIDYFILEHRKSFACNLDKWLRRRVRACYWKTWRLPRTRVRKLKSFGVPHDEAMSYGNSRKGYWRMSMTSPVQRSLSNAWLAAQGLFSLEERWTELAPKRRIA